MYCKNFVYGLDWTFYRYFQAACLHVCNEIVDSEIKSEINSVF